FGRGAAQPSTTAWKARSSRSEEHTSELQSHLNLVCRLLLEKKKKKKKKNKIKTKKTTNKKQKTTIKHNSYYNIKNYYRTHTEQQPCNPAAYPAMAHQR